MAEYMNCGTDDERSSFFAFNDYSWCDPSSFTQSGWSQKVQTFSHYGLPLFLSEYGCNTNKREFQEVGSLYSTQMTAVYSGGLVYEYSNEGSNYGLVTIDGDSVTERPDFTALQSAFKKTPNHQGDGGYNKTGGANPCPAKPAPAWNVDSTDALPAIPDAAKKYMTQGAGKGVGFSGSGSQNAGGSGATSTGTAAPGSGSGGSYSTGTSSGSSSSGSSSSSKGAAAGLRAPEMTLAPIVCGLVVTISTFFGASMILI